MEKSKRILQVIGIASSCIAIGALCLSYYYCGDKAQLFKLSVPLLILAMLIFQLQQKTNSGNK